MDRSKGVEIIWAVMWVQIVAVSSTLVATFDSQLISLQVQLCPKVQHVGDLSMFVGYHRIEYVLIIIWKGQQN